jgi:hypothetical protein
MGTLTLISAVADATSYNLDTINSGSAPDDWALYTNSLTPAQRRNGGGSTITATFFGTSTLSNTTETRTPSWTNGTPTTSGSSNADVFNSTFAAGDGFTITLPADTQVRTAWFLVGPFNTSPDTMVFTLSDGSATAITDTTSLTGATGSFNPFLVKVSYSANSASQTLACNFYAGTVTPQTVTLQAVAVAVTGGAPSVGPGFRSVPGPGVSPNKPMQFAARALSNKSSTDITVALTGQSATFAQGTLTSSLSISLTGLAGTFSQGTVVAIVPLVGRPMITGPGISPDYQKLFTPRRFSSLANASTDITVALTGQSATFAQGSLSPGLSVALTGQAATFAQGTLSSSLSVSLTGQAATFAAGSMTPNISVALGGNSATFSTGVLTATAGGNVTVALTGQSATFTQGSLSPTITAALTGQSGTFSAGSLSKSSSVGLTGIILQSSLGHLSPSGGTPVLPTGVVGTGVVGTGVIGSGVVGTGIQH